MKYNKEITSKNEPIYDENSAEALYDNKKYSHRKLSMMKQENFRMAIKDKKITLITLIQHIKSACGYCFESNSNCGDCILYRKLKNRCDETDEWNKMCDATRRKDFAEHHKAWCKRLGIWNDKWE